MPGIATHYVFGTDAYRAAELAIGDRPEGLAAFLMGNQGPDPFFSPVVVGCARGRRGPALPRARAAELVLCYPTAAVKAPDPHNPFLYRK